MLESTPPATPLPTCAQLYKLKAFLDDCCSKLSETTIYDLMHHAQAIIPGATKNNTFGLDAAVEGRQQIVAAIKAILHVLEPDLIELTIAQGKLRNAQRPAVDLPVEILSRIFELACLSPRSTKFRQTELFEIRNIRNSIVSTCSHWRWTAIHTTSLWSIITPLSASRLSPPQELISMELERAAGHAIDLQLWLDGDPDWVVSMLRSNISRCRSLDVIICDDKITGFLMNEAFTSPLSLARLEYFKCVPKYSEWNLEVVLTELDLSNATALREFHCEITEVSFWPANAWDIHQYDYETRLRLPLPRTNKLKRLQFNQSVNIKSVRAYLPMCLQLESLRMFGDGEVPYDLLPTALHQLKHIRMEGSAATRALDMISAPNVECFEVRCYADGDEDSGALTIGRWYEQVNKFPNLRHVSLEIPEKLLPSKALAKFLNSHACIEEIVLKGRPFDMELPNSLGGDTFYNIRRLSIQLSNPNTDQVMDAAINLLSMRASRLSASDQTTSDHTYHLSHSFELSIHVLPCDATTRLAAKLLKLEKWCDIFPGVLQIHDTSARLDDKWSWGNKFTGVVNVY